MWWPNLPSGKVWHAVIVASLMALVLANNPQAVSMVTIRSDPPSSSEMAVNGAMNTRTRNVENSLASMCPNMVRYVFENATPRDEADAGIFETYSSADFAAGEEVDLRACVAACCEKEHNNTCNVVFVFKHKCYHVRCVSNEACLPKQRPQVKDRLQMILINPVRQHGVDDENVTWLDVLKASKSEAFEDLSSDLTANPLSFWKQSHKFHYPAAYEDDDFPLTEKRMKQLFMGSADDSANITPDDLAYYGTNLPDSNLAELKFITCEVALSDLGNRCPVKEECVPLRPNSAAGICKCVRGYVRNQMRECVLQEMDYQQLLDDGGVSGPHNDIMAVAAAEPIPLLAQLDEKKSETKTESAESLSLPNYEASKQKLLVSVESKEVRLPETEVTLSAYTVPDEESSGVAYKYLWTLISQPKGPMNGTISDQSESKVKLSNLSEGLYTFKVAVTGANNTYGEAMANVTVLPQKRINRVPQAIITPAEQNIRQPTTNAILDGSTSTDDDKIINWHWEVISSPIGYQPKLPEVNTLQLTDLTLPGNYTFKLTVTDSDNVTNSTTANITVLKGTDYPPVANAGDAVILYLPNNNVTLNGTASSDDHEIVAWEWTKDASDETKAVDMQNTRTPYAQLSNLEEGIYTFVLKVTDGSGQSSTAKVHVFVKPPTNTPPVAVAGANNTVNLPQNWALLNGTLSTDDIRIVSYQWKQVSGPNTAVLSNANSSVTNTTSLTLGLYEFQLSVVDENNNTDSDRTWIQITQEKNAAPIANAGEDQIVALPLSALYLNGSKSWDDLAIVKYMWTRDDASLAAGVVVGDSDKQPVLILTNLVAGHYLFKLTVSDEQGLSSTDSVDVIVHTDPMLMHLVQLTLPKGISALTQAELNTVVQKISLLLGDMKIYVRELKYDPHTDATILVFYVESTGGNGQKPSAVDGLSIEQLLKEKLLRDASILGAVYTDVRTTVCQNKCSGHGVCDTATRACICETFWMPSVTYYWGWDEANCDWSVLYVIVGVIVMFLLLSGVFWSVSCACRQNKKPRARPKLQKYSLIGTQDEEAPHSRRTTSLSDSDTDSDVLFETRTKPNGILRLNGASKGGKHSHGQKKYASTKLSRKVKT